VQAFPTILSGDLNGNDRPNFANNGENSYHVVTGSGTDSSAVLDSFIITAGNANGGSFGAASTAGGGVYNYAGSPTIVYCTLRENYASWEGGAMFDQHNSSPALTSCTIISNQSNAGGGMFNRDHSNPSLINCLVADNSSPSFAGGGIEDLETSSPTFINCTFYGNSAMYAGAAVYNMDWSSGLTATNCIFWANIATLQQNGGPISSNQATITYSCVEDADPNDATVFPGIGNIDDDPRLVEPLGADNLLGTGDENLRLRPDSPCLDAGNNAAVPAGLTTDLDGDPRIVGAGVDMGAFEGPHQALVLSARSVAIDEGDTATLTVSLAMTPGGPVNVTVTRRSGDTDIGVADGGLLMFNPSNYATPQTVTLVAGPDLDWLNGTALIELSAPGLTSAAVTATERDTDVPPILYVDQSATGKGTGESWANAYTDLQEALGLVSVQPQVREIRVAQGTYRPAPAGGSRQVSFRLLDNVAVYGGFPGGGGTWEQRDPAAHPAILSGDLNGDDVAVTTASDLLDTSNRGDNSYHVVRADGCDATAVLDGFTITGGNANGAYPDELGGGIYGGLLTLQDCTVSGNSAAFSGGGIEADGTLSNCTITRNAAGNYGGGLMLHNSTLTDCTIGDNWSGYSGGGISMYTSTLTRCRITGNSAQSGAGVGIDSGAPTFTQCVFSGNSASNQGGAVYGWEMEVSHFDDCVFLGNSADSGGAVSQGDCDSIFTGCQFLGNTAANGGAIENFGYNLPIFVNSTFSGNSAQEDGGGVLNREGSIPVFTNCTFSANLAGQDGGGVASAGNYSNQIPDNIKATNCIFWNNDDSSGAGESAQIYQEGGASAVNYSCVQGWTGALGGTGNIGADPRFLDADGADNVAGTEDDNLRLQAGSSAINTGSNAAVPAGLFTDLDGNPRIVGGSVDMGAYEFVVHTSWAGQGDGNWEDASQWAGDLTSGPDRNTDVVIDAPHTVLVHAPQEVNSLAVCGGGEASLAVGASLAVAGNIAVSASGTVELGPGASLTSGGTLTLDGGSVVRLSEQNSGGAADPCDAAVADTVSAASFDLRSGIVNAGLSGPGGLTKTTAGTVVLSGANTYTGGTTVSEGLLVVNDSSALSAGSMLSIGPDGSVVLGDSALGELSMTTGTGAPAESGFAATAAPSSASAELAQSPAQAIFQAAAPATTSAPSTVDASGSTGVTDVQVSTVVPSSSSIVANGAALGTGISETPPAVSQGGSAAVSVDSSTVIARTILVPSETSTSITRSRIAPAVPESTAVATSLGPTVVSTPRDRLVSANPLMTFRATSGDTCIAATGQQEASPAVLQANMIRDDLISPARRANNNGQDAGSIRHTTALDAVVLSGSWTPTSGNAMGLDQLSSLQERLHLAWKPGSVANAIDRVLASIGR
jgi:autotransporter-associated beta strand protein